ncbi:MAG: chain length determinant protein tyrosine kinase EpsG [Gammaproteobacteria bacterium]|nr:chain length determinant protein tyrosine kinase EpsG [Gammaproteobacteria bacterium]
MKEILEVEPEEAEAAETVDQSLGKLLSDSGKINNRDVERVLAFAKKKGLRFGEAAVKLRVLKKADVDHALAAQFDYPYIREGDGLFGKELIAAYKPFTPKVEALRSLRVQLMLGSFNSSSNALAIVSPGPGEGRSYIAANLAVVFSQLGERTLLIDAHMQNPTLHKIFRVEDSPGLSSALGDRTSGKIRIVNIPQFKNLSLLPAGARPPNPDELLARDAFAAICSRFGKAFDVALIDTPPGDSSTAADWVADRCGKALIVARRDVTRFEDARTFVTRMRSRAEVVGSVLNQF